MVMTMDDDVCGSSSRVTRLREWRKTTLKHK